MKNKILLLIFAFLVTGSAMATEKDSLIRFPFHRVEFPASLIDDCDSCGCSASGGSMGFSSMLNNNFVGVRYFYQSYSSRDGIFANSPWVDENFNTVQVWAKIPITESIQVSALVPYHFHNRELSTGTEGIEGLGDITVLAMYEVARTANDSAVYTHKLQMGGGLKVPTGKYDVANNLGTVNPGFQLGTGSLDYLLAAEYVIKRKQLGLNTMLNYSFKTENKKNYQFGNQLNYSSILFYLFDLDSIKLVPHAGIAGELYETNKHYGQYLPDTSGDVLFGKFGIEGGKENLSLGFTMMQPLNQNLNGGNVEANFRWSINLNYTL